jgi:hypothetical protein
MARSGDDNADVWEDLDVAAGVPGDLDLLVEPLRDAPPDEEGADPDADPDAGAADGGRAARRRRIRWYVLGAVSAVILALVVALGPTWWQLVTQRHASLATPDHLAGLTLDRSADGQTTADYLRTAIAASISLDNSVGAIYDDPADQQRSVMIFGGTGLLLSPDKQLTTAFTLLDDQAGGMVGVQPVPAGVLGGEMKCGTSTGDGGDMPVCGWADHGSIAIAMFPGRSLDDASALMLRMRDGIQKRA